MAKEAKFVSEAIVPITIVAPTEIGEPGMPVRFRWRGAEYEVARVIEKCKTAGDCRHGSGERDVRRHWYWVEIAGGTEMRIYFERQGRPGQNKKRWWLASVMAACDC